MAVGIFAGGVVFGTLLPEMQVEIGGVGLNSFWIGSVLVVVLTGSTQSSAACAPWRIPKRCRLRCSSFGSLMLTISGLNALAAGGTAGVLGSEMFNLWKPLSCGPRRDVGSR